MVPGMGKHSRSEVQYAQMASVNPVVPTAGGDKRLVEQRPATQRPAAGRNRTKAPTAADYGMPAQAPQLEPLSQEQEELLAWLKTMKFKRARFGGVSEEDVWKKISELNRRYDACLRAERARYDALLESRGIKGWPNA